MAFGRPADPRSKTRKGAQRAYGRDLRRVTMLEKHPTSDPTTVHTADWLARYETEYSRDADYVAERLALNVMEEALVLMEEQGVSRTQLASRMGVSRPYVTKIFNALPNLT